MLRAEAFGGAAVRWVAIRLHCLAGMNRRVEHERVFEYLCFSFVT
jgi:hypothetical protein